MGRRLAVIRPEAIDGRTFSLAIAANQPRICSSTLTMVLPITWGDTARSGHWAVHSGRYPST